MTPCVHDLIGRWALATPTATAVRLGDERLCYADLDRRANQVARRLRAAGTGPGSVVAVLLPRSPRLVVTLLGVLKTGAAYVPLSADDPAARTDFLVGDSDATPVVTEAWWRDNADTIGALPTTAPESPVTAADVAYLVYTSGSTGTPKGVQVEHRQLVAYLAWCAGAYRVTDGVGAVLHSPVAYDLSVTSLYAPLVTGRAVVLAPDSPNTAAELADQVAAEDFGFVKLTPAHLPVLADTARPGQRWPGRLVVGGDLLTYESLRLWAAHAPDTVVVNEYGPTETTVGCSVYEFAAGDSRTGPVPIGTGIAGSSLRVLDDDLRPTGSGELYVGGPLVTRGYRNRPGQTASVFLPDPFSDVPGARMYRTGDLVARDDRGDLVYVGRADRQVKIRGFRMHPAEVEAALHTHPDIDAASVVLARRGASDRVVAYVVPTGRRAPTGEEITAHAAHTLPPHMVPDELHLVSSLPLHSNGKVDLARLAADAVDDTANHTGQPVAQPRTPTEAAVAAVFEELLGHPPTGRDTNFLAMGGDSVAATQLMARLSRTHEVHIPMDLWHMAPTVAGLARLIDTYRRDGRDAAIALHEQSELDGFSLDEEILTALEIGDSNATR